jgi:hypothetical protein
MRILAGHVDWKEGLGNRPDLTLLVDRIPPLAWMRFELREQYYFAEHEGFCRFFSYHGNGNNRGFGGAKFEIVMHDGERRVLEGPWSSNSSTMNEHGFGPCMEARFTTDPEGFNHGRYETPGAVLVSLLRDAADVIDVGQSYTWRPGSSYAAEVVFPHGSRFALACSGHATVYRRTHRDNRFVSLPEVFPDGTRVESIRAAIQAALDAKEHDFANEIARRYTRHLPGGDVDALMALSGYEPAVKLPDGSYWVKPATD